MTSPERKAYQRAWAVSHRDELNAARREWLAANPDYDRMLAKQGGVCNAQ